MAKVKLHNPELAANSQFSNLVVESLTTDPTLVGTSAVGRLWFNNTDKTFKGGFLNDAGDATDIKPIGVDNSAEVQANTDAIAQEVIDRTTGDTTLQGNIDTETTNRTTADTTLQGNIDTVSTDLATETTNRTTADTALDTRITDLESAVGTNIGDLSTLTTDSKDNLVNAINELDAHADTNATAVTTETTNRTTADTALQGNIDTVSTDLATETTNRTTADTALQGNIDTLTADVATNYLDKTTTTAQAVAADTTFSSNLVIQGDLTVSGTTTTINTETLQVADNIITLNNGIGAIDPTENAGLEVDRGNDGLTTIIQWNETLDQVEVQEAGTLKKVATTDYVDTQISSTNSDITALDTRVTTAETNITSNDTDIATNVTNINNLQTELDATQTAAGLNADGTYTADNTTNYLATATSLTTADKALDTQLKTTNDNVATETTNRTTADTALDTRITDLESAVGTNIGDLSTLTTDAKDNLVNAINELDAHADTNASDMASEITTRATADTTIATGAGLNIDGTYTANALTNYITTATDLANADKLLDTQSKVNADAIAAVDTRVTSLEDVVTGNIGDLSTLSTDNKDTLVNAINEVDSHIDTEVTNRTTADTTLQTNIDTEGTTRTTNDDALGVRIDNVNTASGLSNDTYTADASTTYLTTATDLMNADKVLDTTIKTNVDNLAATTATNGTNLIGYEGYTESNTNIVNPTIETVAGDLKTTIDTIASLVNTKIHDIENRYVKGEVADADKSDTYTLAHNLDTEFVDVSVQVYDTLESVWRFDLVVIEVIDVNVVKISLASGSAEQIRYVIQGY